MAAPTKNEIWNFFTFDAAQHRAFCAIKLDDSGHACKSSYVFYSNQESKEKTTASGKTCKGSSVGNRDHHLYFLFIFVNNAGWGYESTLAVVSQSTIRRTC